MIPRQLPAMTAAELRKVFTRGSAIATLAVALVVGLGAVGILWQAARMGDGGPSLNGTPLGELLAPSGIQAAGAALWARNFFVLPLFLLLASASAVGGELTDRTLREVAVRPVPRWSLLAARLAALSALSVVSLLLTLVPSLALGTALFGLSGDAATTPGIGALLGGYAASFLSDLGLIALGAAVSLFVSSVGGTVVAVALLLLLDVGLRGLLAVLRMVGVEGAAALTPFTLGNALACWEGWEDGWRVEPFAAMALFLAAFLGASVARLARLDVP